MRIKVKIPDDPDVCRGCGDYLRPWEKDNSTIPGVCKMCCETRIGGKKVYRVGNSHVITVPRRIRRILRVRDGDSVVWHVESSGIVRITFKRRNLDVKTEVKE